MGEANSKPHGGDGQSTPRPTSEAVTQPSPGTGSERLTAKRILEMIERQGHRCALTGAVLTPNTASIDHIVPLVRGGKHHPDNAHVVTRDVNRMKGQLTVAEFVGVCRLVADHHAGVVCVE